MWQSSGKRFRHVRRCYFGISASVKLENEILQALGLSSAGSEGFAFIDFAIPPVSVPNALIRVSQTDSIPFTLARGRPAGGAQPGAPSPGA